MDILPPLHDSALEKTAFTHRSALNEFPDFTESNERLEFLGDAVLELSASKYLYENFPQDPEGTLTNYRSSLVKTTTLAKLAASLGMGQRLILSKGEVQGGGRTNTALLANTFEAYIGALYLDQGFETVDVFLRAHLYPLLEGIRSKNLHKDAKSKLQEYLQSQHEEPPVYIVTKEDGPAHQRLFEVSLQVKGKEIATAEGKTKQDAQQTAATKALEILGKT
ncbi:MAG TPA: ribonuclease III [Candidatus Pacebacteria bacterium]|nr:MAG: Ribonuclease 3 [Microgenomates group bacterium GW2011_GWB1_45_17]KKU24109.1 MAG: Ribonuclease 3 [Microgenomates group bacterium GW2011_GWC1_46_15]KKU24823.1 MAG: Ribonuclease 3 [Microgenomates group bacterium GW2011_GWA1_46_15]HAV14802.1 ribonuclease III [Candidatus Paceibacterota bacterium]HCR11193.1 ribonuclease III [Candidatus Paceibacterota bacterium]